MTISRPRRWRCCWCGGLGRRPDRRREGVAVGAARTPTFLGERYRRIARRRGPKRAVVAVGRSTLVIIWHLLSDTQATFRDLGVDHYTSRINPDRQARNHIRQLEALGYTVTVENTQHQAA